MSVPYSIERPPGTLLLLPLVGYQDLWSSFQRTQQLELDLVSIISIYISGVHTVPAPFPCILNKHVCYWNNTTGDTSLIGIFCFNCSLLLLVDATVFFLYIGCSYSYLYCEECAVCGKTNPYGVDHLSRRTEANPSVLKGILMDEVILIVIGKLSLIIENKINYLSHARILFFETVRRDEANEADEAKQV